MNFPTLGDHNRCIGVEHHDKRPYLERYLEAKGLDADRYSALAQLAFNLVEAKFRLADVSRTIATNNGQRVEAQHDEVAGWQAKTVRFFKTRPSGHGLFEEIVEDFSVMAAESRVPDEEERDFIALGLAGRIGEVEVPPVTELLGWQREDADGLDSAFAGELKW